LIRDALLWRNIADDPIDHDATLPATLRFVHFAIDTILAGSDGETSGPPS
jgi:hypothetical protein